MRSPGETWTAFVAALLLWLAGMLGAARVIRWLTMP